jgi:hypothetical protein
MLGQTSSLSTSGHTLEAGAGKGVSLPAGRTPSYLRSESFDSMLLLGPLAAGLVATAVVVDKPRLFALFLMADLWLLGYHHVVATYTRLAFDRETFRRNRFLALDLLLGVMACVVAITLWAGTWVIATAFLYVQWFHYMRQGYGINRMFFRNTPQGRNPVAKDRVTDAAIYLVPLYCIAQRSATLQGEFLGSPVKALVLPDGALLVLGVAAAAALGVWLVRTGAEIVKGEANMYYAGFTLSHVAIFLSAYVVVDSADIGWLGINIWHNLQYVLIVWMVNAKRYAGGIDPKARFLSAISQPNRMWLYFGTCLAISTLVYFNLTQFITQVLGGGMAMVLAVYMGINFHHYIVDAIIWKRRRVVPQPA